MANKDNDPTRFKFNYKEVVEALVKLKGIREGVWMLGFEIAHKAGCMTQDEKSIPAMFNMITAVTLSRTQEENNLSVDAGKIISQIISIH